MRILYSGAMTVAQDEHYGLTLEHGEELERAF
jgi:hypothetical protein